ncbi:MAG: hypothetical protein KKB50_10040 [Planctomycetes bacterium]|nr:hypothetical protein [Planctomycetota bacterium]
MRPRLSGSQLAYKILLALLLSPSALGQAPATSPSGTSQPAASQRRLLWQHDTGG